jgi:hypothetical protein
VSGKASFSCQWLFATFFNYIAKRNQRGLYSLIILYADDILLLSPTLCGLHDTYYIFLVRGLLDARLITPNAVIIVVLMLYLVRSVELPPKR